MNLGDIMRINGVETNEVIIREIGKRVKSRRIAFSISQKELAFESGISVRTISGFENGENISVSNLISILRVLKLLQELNMIIPDAKVNPEDILNLGRTRQRVSSVKKEKKSPWIWGDDK